MSVRSFDAVCNDETHTLILGSMPGVASLDAVEYYAHKRNAFWPIMLAMIDQVDVDYALLDAVDYPQRLIQLNANGFGLWDVLAECERKGSLDSAIVASSVVVNDFGGLLQRYQNIKTIAFNGKAAQKLFEKHVAMGIEQLGLQQNRLKRNDTKRNDTKRNDTKRNDTKRNDTGQNSIERNDIALSGIELNGIEQNRIQRKSINCISLPSSSPAMASLSLEKKFTLWRSALLG